MRKREPDRLTKGWARWLVSREPAGGCAAFGQLVGVLLAAETGNLAQRSAPAPALTSPARRHLAESASPCSRCQARTPAGRA